MSYLYSHISSAKKIIETYHGEHPFAFHIKKYFSANKKYGSKDRKSIATLCYNYFRLGNMCQQKQIEERILIATFLCQNKHSAILQVLHPDFNDKILLPLQEKIAFLNFAVENVFPSVDEVSDEIDKDSFYKSFFIQPALFLRLRPSHHESVLSKLLKANISFNQLSDKCIELQNTTALDAIINLNKEAVVQDASSQQVFNYLNTIALSTKGKNITVWDCCAASGGKSILLADKLHKKIRLTVSDIRENILHNCKKRLQQAGINMYKNFIADVALPTFTESDKYSIIICDVPCTGSGTWARTPEQLSFFKKNTIAEFEKKQKAIAGNAIKQLNDDGLFFYITCSVFKQENEAVVAFLQAQASVQLLDMQYIKGYEKQADTMFVAVFSKKITA
jgi:16S rRNA (cytosine967-C5)-methyltransferase